MTLVRTPDFPLTLDGWQPWLSSSMPQTAHLMPVVFDLLGLGRHDAALQGWFGVNAYTHDIELAHTKAMGMGTSVRIVQPQDSVSMQQRQTAWAPYHALESRQRWTVLRWLRGTADPEMVSISPEVHAEVLRRMVGEQAWEGYLVAQAVDAVPATGVSRPKTRL